ncbi:hypothetical protein ACTA71_008963 [Dictyostelium dimigraforme]
MCIDTHQSLNDDTIPIPNTRVLTKKTKGVKLLTKTDQANGFHQIHIVEGDQSNTTADGLGLIINYKNDSTQINDIINQTISSYHDLAFTEIPKFVIDLIMSGCQSFVPVVVQSNSLIVPKPYINQNTLKNKVLKF